MPADCECGCPVPTPERLAVGLTYTPAPDGTDPLTAKQEAVLDYVIGRCLDGLPPAVRDIGRQFGMGPNGVMSHLNALEKKGWLTRGEDRARAIASAGGAVRVAAGPTPGAVVVSAAGPTVVTAEWLRAALAACEGGAD